MFRGFEACLNVLSSRHFTDCYNLTLYISRFNEKFLNMAILRSNTIYGALDPETTNVIYVHGSIDPWHALGLTKSTNSQMPTIYIEGISIYLNSVCIDEQMTFNFP